MDAIPLLSGSAGDDMHLSKSLVYHDGRFHRDAALLTLIKIKAPFRIFKCQHFVGSGQRMVVTRADPWKRTVFEINAESASIEYARLLGLEPEALTTSVFAEFPVMVKVGGEFYVRSIQKANTDGSLTFFCAIDEGVVLTLARSEDILTNLEAFFERVRATMGRPQLVLGFDCIFRSLEFEQRQIKSAASRILAANNVIGFNTYGEQYGSMHVNQTLTAAVIGAEDEPND
jgi:hypothetical protein